MSFAVQEELMLALLFDQPLRDRFVANARAVLADFDLTVSEQEDFLCIRTDGLQFDASLRIDLTLSQLTKTWPLTFSLLSSFPGGLSGLKPLVSLSFIKEKPQQRPVYFGLRMRDLLPTLTYTSRQEYALVNAVLEAELAMAYNAAALKGGGNAHRAAAPVPLSEGWMLLPVALAQHVSASVIPLPYARLKEALCPCDGPTLWQHLSVMPFSAVFRQQLLARPDVRLLLARAYRVDDSPTDPVVDFVTMELAEGYAPLFQYVNGEYCVADILGQMRAAGAQPAMLEGIGNGFRQLLERGFLRVV